MHAATCDLLHFLTSQKAEVFDLSGRVDHRRYLGRGFPLELPLLVHVQTYPGYRSMVGENWLHWHDYFEFFVALSGRGEFCIGEERFAFGPGDLVVVEPLKLHGVLRMEATHSALVAFFPRSLVSASESPADEAFLGAWEQRGTGAAPLLAAGNPRAPEVHEALLQLVESWFSPRQTPEHWMSLKIHLLVMLARLRQALVTSVDAPLLTNSERGLREIRLRRALDFISRRCLGPLSQADVAAAAGMSTSRFRAFFKETTGLGFARYLIEKRVEHAARFLTETEDSIASIAYKTGFSDQSHLLRCFKDKFGMSPSAYRQASGGG